MMPIKTIEPAIFSKEIHAFFTLKNEQLSKKDQQISGLNLGYNTEEVPEIITQNRNELFNEFDIDHNWIAFAHQMHGNRVKIVSAGGTFADTDGLVTQVPGLALAIQVADCAAVLIAEEQSKTIAAVHAGWRGAAGNILPRTIEKINEIGVDPCNCRAFVSPCISATKFEVGQQVADQFPSAFVDFEHFSKPHINLKGFLKHQLQQGGLPENQIEIHPGCTVDDKKFYSYRREAKQSGRMMAIVQIKNNLI